jgi:hypothetical protein
MIKIFCSLDLSSTFAQNFKPNTNQNLKQMKKLTKAVLAILVVASSITACKKGEDDPALSLRSRDSRLTGEWTLVSMEKTVNGTTASSNVDGLGNATTNNTTLDYTEKVDGSIKSVTISHVDAQTGGPNPGTNRESTTYKETYTLEMEIVKDGTVIVTTSSTPTSAQTLYSPAKPLPTGFDPSADEEFSFDFGLGWTRSTFDGTYTFVGVTDKSVQTGYWSWADGAKNKVIVNIDGLGRFFVQQLKNKEIVLVQMFDDSDNGTTRFGTTSMTKKTNASWTFEAK